MQRALGKFTGCCIAISLATGAAGVRAETMDQLYEKAKREKALLLYGAGPTAPYERWTKEFAQRFPGIDIVITGGFSNVLDTKINQQLKAGTMEVDIAFFQTVQDFVAWKKTGALLPFKVDGFDKIAPEFRDKDGAFTTTSVNTISYIYNTKLVAPAEVPKSALDFLKPQFRGKLVTAYPADDDATLYAFYTIVQKYGWGYMDKYMAQKPNFIQGHLGETRSIVDGTYALTFDGLSSSGGALKASGAPIDFAFSTADPTPAFILTAGIFKGAPHPNAAKLYLDWYMAKEQQSRIGTFSARIDVPPPPGFKPLSAYNLANHYREFVTNEPRMVALRKRFEAYTGPVVNQGGVK